MATALCATTRTSTSGAEEKRFFAMPLRINSDHFAKTGSGQT
jgi:hypothetical protein